MSDKEKKENAIPVTLIVDAERKVTNDGAGRSLAVALKMFKDTVLKLSAKKVLKLADRLVKWGLYLQKEIDFAPKSLKAYKQREIILVDFGFNVGSEFGGRHYAVVLEKDNKRLSFCLHRFRIGIY